MIEAVNSVISNAPILRAASVQIDSSQVAAAAEVAPSGEQPVPQAPYVSPYIRVDNDYNKAVLQIRDSDTGDVIRQFPSETRLAQNEASASLQAAIEKKSAPQPAKNEFTVRGRTSEVPHQQSSHEDEVTLSAQAQASISVTAKTPHAQAQAAVAAFSAGAQAGSKGVSAGVSVVA